MAAAAEATPLTTFRNPLPHFMKMSSFSSISLKQALLLAVLLLPLHHQRKFKLISDLNKVILPKAHLHPPPPWFQLLLFLSQLLTRIQPSSMPIVTVCVSPGSHPGVVIIRHRKCITDDSKSRIILILRN